MLLDDIGYTRCREGLFDDFLTEVWYATPALDGGILRASSSRRRNSNESEGSSSTVGSKRFITVDDMRNLYKSEPYVLPMQANFNNGEVLMKYVENVFRKSQSDITGDDALNADEMRDILRTLLGGRDPTEEELDKSIDAFDTDKDGRIELDDFKTLKSQCQ